MHPATHAREHPGKPAYIMGRTGETVTYADLDARSNQGAHLFRSLGIERGDTIALFMDNHPRLIEVLWAAQRSGLRFTAISTKLTPDELEYIVQDCNAKALIASDALSDVALALAPRVPGLIHLMVGAARSPYASFEEQRVRFPTTPISDQGMGGPMLYSSGTTGRPKGVRSGITGLAPYDAPNGLVALAQARFGWHKDSVYLSPAPLYHAAPLGWAMAANAMGGTIIVMERFEPEEALTLIERYRVTTAQWVPTHFTRLLKLPAQVRAKYNTSSLDQVFHAGAPCPIRVKEQMIEWWGPIITEYYAGTEGAGMTMLDSREWLAHKGSVGRVVLGSQIRICDDADNPLPPRCEGTIYFEGGGRFEYHNDPAKTAEVRNKHGWTTLGDIGWLDEEGYLYLTDRKSFMIISGGVNIYPQEIENLLVTHPKVADAAVIGAPHEEMGEQVVAVIQPLNWSDAGDELAAELTDFARANLSHVKAPRRIDFMAELPRHQTGKLYKRLIRDAYWGKSDSKIV